MTNDEKLNALIEALKQIAKPTNWDGAGSWCVDSYPDEIARKALAAFAPEPEYEYVLPDWCELAKSHSAYRGKDTNDMMMNLSGTGYVICKGPFDALRELTRVPKRPKGREE